MDNKKLITDITSISTMLYQCFDTNSEFYTFIHHNPVHKEFLNSFSNDLKQALGHVGPRGGFRKTFLDKKNATKLLFTEYCNAIESLALDNNLNKLSDLLSYDAAQEIKNVFAKNMNDLLVINNKFNASNESTKNLERSWVEIEKDYNSLSESQIISELSEDFVMINNNNRSKKEQIVGSILPWALSLSKQILSEATEAASYTVKSTMGF